MKGKGEKVWDDFIFEDSKHSDLIQNNIFNKLFLEG